MNLLVIIAASFISVDDGLNIKLPRSWMLGEDISVSSLQKADVIACLGNPDTMSIDFGSERWVYRRIGMWIDWEIPLVMYSVTERSPETVAVIQLLTPAPLHPLLLLVGATYSPRESLMRIGCFALGVRLEWDFTIRRAAIEKPAVAHRDAARSR